MPKNRKFLIAALVVFLALAYLGYRGFSGSASYYFTVSEVVEKGNSVYGQSLRVNGDVVEGSVDWKPERLTLSFVMEEAGESLPVTYKGIAPDTFQAGSEVVVLARPEDIHVLPGHQDGPNRLPGTVDFIRDIGATVEIIADCAGEKVISMMTPKDRPAVDVGAEVTVEFPAAACNVLRD